MEQGGNLTRSGIRERSKPVVNAPFVVLKHKSSLIPEPKMKPKLWATTRIGKYSIISDADPLRRQLLYTTLMTSASVSNVRTPEPSISNA